MSTCVCCVASSDASSTPSIWPCARGRAALGYLVLAAHRASCCATQGVAALRVRSALAATQQRACAAYRHRRVEVEAARCADAAEQLRRSSLRSRRARQRVRHAARHAEAAGCHRVRRLSIGRPRINHAGAAARDEAQARRRRRRGAAAAPLQPKPPASGRGQPQQPHASPPRSCGEDASTAAALASLREACTTYGRTTTSRQQSATTPSPPGTVFRCTVSRSHEQRRARHVPDAARARQGD